MQLVDQNDSFPLSFTTTDANGAPANPTLMVVTVTPDATGIAATPAVVTNPVGTHTIAAPTNLAGRYTVYAQATGANLSAYADSYTVAASVAWPGIVSLADAKAHMNIPTTSTADDEEIRSFILTASAYLENRYGPLVRQTFTDTGVTPSASGLLLRHYPVISLTSVAGAYGYTAPNTDVSTLHVTDAGMLCSNYGATWLGCYPLTVTYVAGLITMPADVQKACLEIVKGLWDSQRGAAQTAFDAEMGGTEAMPGMGLTYWRADKLMEPYRKPVVA